MTFRCSRKSFLRGLGAATVAGPFLRLLERRGEAAPPRRLVIVVTPNGTVMSAYWPGAGCVYGPILKPLQLLQKKLLVMRGIDMKSAYKAPIPRDHLPDLPNALTGRQPLGGDYSNNKIAGISIDQHIASTVGKTTKFASLALGVQNTYSSAWPLLGSGPGLVILPENSPQKTFDRLFTNLATPAAGMAMAAAPIDPTLERLRADRASMLDNLRHELGIVRCELGAAERPKFDAHMAALRDLEKSLTYNGTSGGAVGAGCKKPDPPGSPADFPTVGAVQTKNLMAALACDLTRVAVLQWSSAASSVSHTWANAPAGHHLIAHGLAGPASEAERNQWLTNIETWYAGRFYDLIKALDAIPEGDGTMLDNTAVLWVHEQSVGLTHQRTDMPYVLAGSCGGAFRVGRCLSFKGVPHNNLLISLAEAMGVPTPTFGDPATSSGPLAELH